LCEPGVGIPSDFSEVAYIDISSDWKQQLTTKLEAISITVDLMLSGNNVRVRTLALKE